jgi:hypothetical protein
MSEMVWWILSSTDTDTCISIGAHTDMAFSQKKPDTHTFQHFIKISNSLPQTTPCVGAFSTGYAQINNNANIAYHDSSVKFRKLSLVLGTFELTSLSHKACHMTHLQLWTLHNSVSCLLQQVSFNSTVASEFLQWAILASPENIASTLFRFFYNGDMIP